MSTLCITYVRTYRRRKTNLDARGVARRRLPLLTISFNARAASLFYVLYFLEVSRALLRTRSPSSSVAFGNYEASLDPELNAPSLFSVISSVTLSRTSYLICISRSKYIYAIHADYMSRRKKIAKFSPCRNSEDVCAHLSPVYTYRNDRTREIII